MMIHCAVNSYMRIHSKLLISEWSSKCKTSQRQQIINTKSRDTLTKHTDKIRQNWLPRNSISNWIRSLVRSTKKKRGYSQGQGIVVSSTDPSRNPYQKQDGVVGKFLAIGWLGVIQLKRKEAGRPHLNLQIAILPWPWFRARQVMLWRKVNGIYQESWYGCARALRTTIDAMKRLASPHLLLSFLSFGPAVPNLFLSRFVYALRCSWHIYCLLTFFFMECHVAAAFNRGRLFLFLFCVPLAG